MKSGLSKSIFYVKKRPNLSKKDYKDHNFKIEQLLSLNHFATFCNIWFFFVKMKLVSTVWVSTSLSKSGYSQRHLCIMTLIVVVADLKQTKRSMILLSFWNCNMYKKHNICEATLNSSNEIINQCSSCLGLKVSSSGSQINSNLHSKIEYFLLCFENYWMNVCLKSN